MPNPTPHKPTRESRQQVIELSSYGVPQEDISKVIGIDRKTLGKYYREELDTASLKANAMVAGKLYQKCMDGDSASIFFWLKTRAKWKETHTLEHTGKDGDVLKIFNFDTIKPKDE